MYASESVREPTPRQVEALRVELAPLKPRALKKRAAASGVDPDSVEEADDADDVKARLIELIVEQEERRLSGGAPSSSGDPGVARRARRRQVREPDLLRDAPRARAGRHRRGHSA